MILLDFVMLLLIFNVFIRLTHGFDNLTVFVDVCHFLMFYVIVNNFGLFNTKIT
jgi:hypothetical protein